MNTKTTLKTIIVTIVFSILINYGGFAQDVKHHEITGSLSLLSDVQIIGLAVDASASMLTGQAIHPGSYYLISPSLSYKYWFNSGIALGASALMDFNSVKIRHHYLEQFKEYSRYIPTVAMEFSVNYLNSSWIQLYGMVGAGVSVAFSPDPIIKTIAVPNFQLSPLGVRVGKRLGAFLEVGFGYKGIVNFGLSCKF